MFVSATPRKQTNYRPGSGSRERRIWPRTGLKLADHKTGCAHFEKSALRFYRSGAYWLAAARRRFRNLFGATDLDAPAGEVRDRTCPEGRSWTTPRNQFPWFDLYRPTQA